MDGTSDVSAIASQMTESYACEADRCEAEVLAFCRELTDMGFAERIDEYAR